MMRNSKRFCTEGARKFDVEQTWKIFLIEIEKNMRLKCLCKKIVQEWVERNIYVEN